MIGTDTSLAKAYYTFFLPFIKANFTFICFFVQAVEALRQGDSALRTKYDHTYWPGIALRYDLVAMCTVSYISPVRCAPTRLSLQTPCRQATRDRASSLMLSQHSIRCSYATSAKSRCLSHRCLTRTASDTRASLLPCKQTHPVQHLNIYDKDACQKCPFLSSCSSVEQLV